MLITVQFEPGIWSDEADLASENRYKDGSNVRFRRGRAQIIGGWEAVSSTVISAPVRGGCAWASSTQDRLFAFGTALQLVSYYGGSYLDITPEKAEGTLVDPFSTVNGDTLVTVRDLDHGFKSGDTVTFTYANDVGGLTIDGDYTVSVKTNDIYTITHTSAATSSVNGGGGIVEFEADLDLGLIDGTGGTGYGTGPYGEGFYGLPTQGDTDPRTWSMWAWGTNLLASPNNGAIYEYQPLPAYNDILRNGSFDTTADWTLGTGWSITGGALVGSAGSESNADQDVTGVMSGGVVYEMEIDATVSAGSFRLKIERADLDDNDDPIVENFGEPIAKTGFYAPGNPTKIRLTKNATFAGSVSSIAIRPVSKAYRIAGAPQYNRGMFVDPHGVVVVYGTVKNNGVYDAMAIRWSDKDRNTVWLTDVDNLAGQDVLKIGSRIIGGLPAGGQNIIFSDAAAYTMRWTGAAGQAFLFDLIGTGCGLIGKNAVAEHQGVVYWLGVDGQFRVYSGGAPQIIECPIRREVIDNLAPSQNEKIYAGVNAEYNEIWFCYPDKRDGNGLECSRIAVFDFAQNIWWKGLMARSTWIAPQPYEKPITFDPGDGRAYFQERGNTANGNQIEWFLETGKFNIEDGDKLFTVHRYVPDFENQVGNVNVTFTPHQFQRSVPYAAQSGTITPTKTDLPLRTPLGREYSIRWSNGTNSRFVRFGSDRLDVVRTGARR